MSGKVKIQLYLAGVPADLVMMAASTRGLSLSAYARMALLAQVRADVPECLFKVIDETGKELPGQVSMFEGGSDARNNA